MVKGFPKGSVVKNLPAMQGMKFQALGQEDPQEGNGNPLQCSYWRVTLSHWRVLRNEIDG